MPMHAAWASEDGALSQATLIFSLRQGYFDHKKTHPPRTLP